MVRVRLMRTRRSPGLPSQLSSDFTPTGSPAGTTYPTTADTDGVRKADALLNQNRISRSTVSWLGGNGGIRSVLVYVAKRKFIVMGSAGHVMEHRTVLGLLRFP